MSFHDKAIKLYTNAYKCLINKETKIDMKYEINRITKQLYSTNLTTKTETTNNNFQTLKVNRRSLSESSLSVVSSDSRQIINNHRRCRNLRNTKFFSKDSNYSSSSSSSLACNTNVTNKNLSIKKEHRLTSSEEDLLSKSQITINQHLNVKETTKPNQILKPSLKIYNETEL